MNTPQYKKDKKRGSPCFSMIQRLPFLVPVVGLEPTRGISPTDFESVTSTIPSHRLFENRRRPEPAAVLELDARFELATS